MDSNGRNPFEPPEEGHTVVEMDSIPLHESPVRARSPNKRAARAEHAASTSSPPRSPSLTVRTDREKGTDARRQSGEMSARSITSPSQAAVFRRSEKSAKFELFEVDPLVTTMGLKSMGGQPDDVRSPRNSAQAGTADQKDRAQLGTLMGVFIPCLQNIMGIVLFIRLSWIVGMAGIGQTLAVVILCCSCTFLTTLSLSAIATNGAMKGGGPYFLIGRALGPEVGVTIGLCFFFGNACAAALYVLGGVETVLEALPGLRIFGTKMTELPTQLAATNATSPVVIVAENSNLHDMQLYGVIITALLGVIVFGGAKLIARVGPAFLVPVLVSVLLVFIGILVAPQRNAAEGLTGLMWRNFGRNWGSAYQTTNTNGVPDPRGDVTWAFSSMCGLFFPAVTGILAGSNRSAALKDPQRSIPVGTVAAQLTSSAIYIVAVILFGAVAARQYLLTDRLLTANVAWPVPGVVSFGIVLSTLGAALQSLTGAPYLLAAIANDEILPVLNWLKPRSTEPYRAVILTLTICALCVLIGNLDLITPIITMFFLICYAGVNLSCFLLDLLDAPSWRPRWPWHHWLLSGTGAALCIALMFLISWVFTIISLVLAALIYYYVSVQGKAGDWGDGFKSAYFQLALRSLRTLGAKAVHPKNWYPVPLVYCKPWGILPSDVPCHPMLPDFANCMKKKGRGMSIFVSILEGEFADKEEEAREARRTLSTYIEYKRCEAVAEVLVAKSVEEGFRTTIQSMGLGNLKPNMVCMRYPEIWRDERAPAGNVASQFVNIIKDCHTAGKAVVIVKGIDEWPGEDQKQYGTIDLYWIVRDGGFMLLLAMLLRSKKSFEGCKIRVFAIADEQKAGEQLREDVKKFLYDLRVQAEVYVINMRAWEDEISKEEAEGDPERDETRRMFAQARKRIGQRANHGARSQQQDSGAGKPSSTSGHHQDKQEEEKTNHFLLTTIRLNAIVRKFSRTIAAVVLVSLPPPPPKHPPYNYMEYMDLLVDRIPRLLLVRGYKRDVVTVYS